MSMSTEAGIMRMAATTSKATPDATSVAFSAISARTTFSSLPIKAENCPTASEMSFNTER